MADTIRSTDDLLNASTGLFKDNTAGDISAQDLRDFVLSTYRPQAFVGGRLTLEQGVSVSSTDQTGRTNVYYTPHAHSLIGLYDGTSWKLHTFTERTLALGTLTSGRNYDVFLYDNAGTLTLELSAAWNSDNITRTDALTTQDGVYVKSGATSRRWLGTIRTTATTTTEDSEAKRFVWNLDNRVQRRMYVADTTSHTYNSATIQQYRATSTNKIERVVGLADIWTASLRYSSLSDASSQPSAGVDLDSTTTFGTGMVVRNQIASVTQSLGFTFIFPRSSVTAGYHYISINQQNLGGAGTATHVNAIVWSWGWM